MALLSDADLLPGWVAEGCERAPWEPEDVVPPEIPAWLLGMPASVEEPACGCGCALHPAPPVAAEPVRWAVPGLWDDEPTPACVSVGSLVGQVQSAVSRLAEVAPASLAPGPALVEAAALLEVQRQLRVLQLGRLRDVSARRLFEGAGFRSSTAWLRTVAPDARAADRTLAERLPALPRLHEAVLAGRVPLTGADKVAGAMRKVSPYLDDPDGLLDGHPADPVVEAVVSNVVDLVCKDRFGLTHDPAADPAAAALLDQLEAETAAIAQTGGSQRDRVEQAMVLLATHVHPLRLAGPVEELVLSLVPSQLEEQDKSAQDKRALALAPNDDGTWQLAATLTPEAGERLHAALAAEARRDPANPVDTAARAEQRAQQAQAAGLDPWAGAEELPAWELRALREQTELLPDAERLVPRSRSKRMHDAFNRLLARYLETGLGGVHGKVPVQATVTVSERTVRDAPGAPPAHGASGQPLARSLLRRWWCDAHVTTLLMSRGWKPLGVVHTARTITGTELTALRLQFDNRCPGLDCCPATPDPLVPLVPHHVRRHALFGRTSLDETLLVCERLHADLHVGKRTIRLRDGRLVDENGYVTDGQESLPVTGSAVRD